MSSTTDPGPLQPWQETYVSYSELAAFRQCPLKWRWSYRDRWDSDRAKPALDRGTVWDAMLQTHYAGWMAGQDRADTSLQTLETLREAGMAEVEDVELLEWMYDGYVSRYLEEDRATWDVLANQLTMVLPLPDPDDPTKDGPIGLKVKIDRVARHRPTKGLWVWDDKTGKQQPKQAALDIDDQFKLYQWGLRRTGRQVAGFLVNHARTERLKRDMAGDERFVRHRLTSTDVELAAVALDAARAAAEIHRPDRREFSSPNSGLGGCNGWCDYFDAHLTIRRGTPEEVALRSFGFERRPRQALIPARGPARSDKAE